MTSALALVALTYGGHDIQDIEGIYLDLFRGGPGQTAEVGGTTRLIPGRDGMIPGNRRVRRRRIELVGIVTGTGTTAEDQIEDYWVNRLTMDTWFDPTALASLVATLPGGISYSIQARTVQPPDYTQIAPMLADPVTVVMESYDPDWEATGS